jgi:hypothetical protein
MLDSRWPAARVLLQLLGPRLVLNPPCASLSKGLAVSTCDVTLLDVRGALRRACALGRSSGPRSWRQARGIRADIVSSPLGPSRSTRSFDVMAANTDDLRRSKNYTHGRANQWECNYCGNTFHAKMGCQQARWFATCECGKAYERARADAQAAGQSGSAVQHIGRIAAQAQGSRVQVRT